jgi:outer membrane protein TolC
MPGSFEADYTMRATTACLTTIALGLTSVAAAEVPSPQAAPPRPVKGWTLKQIQDHARAQDLRVLAAEAQLRSFHAMYEQAAWAWFPKLETFLTVAGPTPEAKRTMPAGASGASYEDVTTASQLYNFNFGRPGVLVAANVTGAIPIFTFGKLTALKEAGEKGVIIGEALRDRARAEAVYQCAQAFYGYQLARTIESDLNDATTQLTDARKRIGDMLKADSAQVTKLDTYKIEFFASVLESQKAAARKGRDLATAALRLLAGIAEADPFDVVQEDLVDPKLQVLPVDRYVAVAAGARPEVRLAEAGVAARDREVFIRQRFFFPDFFLAGMFSASYSTNADVVTNPFYYDRYNKLEGGVGLTARITFDLPMKWAQLAQAEAERDKTMAERDLLNKAIGLEVKQTVGDLNEALARIASYGQSERSARRWSTGAFADFGVGLSDTRELVESIAARSFAGAEHLRALHDAHVALAALERVVGLNPRDVH